ncbi:Coiled-coil domain-containing protein 47 [Blomia tropicalis]|nr:Coiled-coil domain-containing protein 47 [Blomia tropicalis]
MKETSKTLRRSFLDKSAFKFINNCNLIITEIGIPHQTATLAPSNPSSNWSMMASTNSNSSFSAVNDACECPFDMAGKIVIKAEYGDIIRKVPIMNDEITYDELLVMMCRLFKLQPSDEIEIKYRDEDNDLVTIMDGNDLQFAIHCNRLLRLKLYVNTSSTSTPSINGSDETKVIRDELIKIRNCCIDLLEKIDLSENIDQMLQNTVDKLKKKNDEMKVFKEAPKELDPLRSNSPVATIDAEQSVIKTTAAAAAAADTEPKKVDQGPIGRGPPPAPFVPRTFPVGPPPGLVLSGGNHVASTIGSPPHSSMSPISKLGFTMAKNSAINVQSNVVQNGPIIPRFVPPPPPAFTGGLPFVNLSHNNFQHQQQKMMIPSSSVPSTTMNQTSMIYGQPQPPTGQSWPVSNRQ